MPQAEKQARKQAEAHTKTTLAVLSEIWSDGRQPADADAAVWFHTWMRLLTGRPRRKCSKRRRVLNVQHLQDPVGKTMFTRAREEQVELDRGNCGQQIRSIFFR